MQRVSDLRPLGRQARRHTDDHVDKIAASIRTFDFVNPILIDDRGRIIAGVGRWLAAKKLGLLEVPCIRVTHLNDGQKRAYLIAENRLAELAGWDKQILALELRELKDMDLGFDLEITGWNTIELETLILSLDDQDCEDAPTPTPQTASSRVGDRWSLGNHVLACGDALLNSSYDALMAHEKARAVWTDEPFNVTMRDISSKPQRNFPMGCGELDDVEFTAFLSTSMDHMKTRVVDGGLLYMVMDWRHMPHLLDAAKAQGLHFINLCVWNKMRGGMGSFYRSQHELVFIFKSGPAPHLNRIQLGRNGRDRSNIWDYPGVSGLKRKGEEERVPHPTPKPVQMIRDMLIDCTEPGDIVLDPFAGGGSLLIAAERTGRRARVMDLDPIYVDMMIQRWQRLTGKQATLISTGQSFADVSAERAQAAAALITRVRTRTAPAIPTRIRERRAEPTAPQPVRIRHRSSTSVARG